ncbi:MAG: MotA/TolQ/ExbB proton channel family protein [Akkermansiaceae bacterium]|nr:MotA/TolQ/ExbB proton channel family protein [Akkermansiaceae bacterium]
MTRQTNAENKRKFWGKMIWISAASLVLSICAGVAVPVLAMINAFSSLSPTGATDPSELASSLSTALIGVIISVPFALAALVLFIVAIMRHRKFSNPIQAG